MNDTRSEQSPGKVQVSILNHLRIALEGILVWRGFGTETRPALGRSLFLK